MVRTGTTFTTYPGTCVHVYIMFKFKHLESKKWTPLPKIFYTSLGRATLQALQRAKDIDCYTIMGVVTYIYQVICK